MGDAICISQNDTVEKGKQVAMIDIIFRNALKLLIWLGDHADSSELLFTPERPKSRLHPTAAGKEQCGLALSESADRSLIWVAFLRRRYWRRLWTVQEIILARLIEVHCGDSCASWTSLIEPHCEGIPTE
jgi:Heterokaryon incompatibility protein (HET)